MFDIPMKSCARWFGASMIAMVATVAEAEPAREADYALPAQELARSIRDVALRSGMSVVAPSELVAGKEAPPLKGRYGAQQAIQLLLEGSGLKATLTGGSLVISRAEAPARSESSPGPSPDESQLVTVTGTRIRGGRSASPVAVTSRRDLERAGVTDLAGFTRILPQNFTGGQNPGVAGGGQGGQANINNSATLNLRGLGPDATLTLINGHRIAYDAVSQGIDIAAIPLSAVERIEVIADGSSALYGSDAVGGVANIILRRDYDGLETSARIGASTEGGNFQQQYSAVGGKRWTSGGVMLAIDHSRATPIYADQRDYTERLDPSLTLTLRNRQWSGVLAGHQQITNGVRLEIDGYAMQRRALKQQPFLATADVFTNGQTSRPELKSWAAAPTIRAGLPGGWEGSLGAIRAISQTRLYTTRYFNGAALLSSRLSYENRMSGLEAGAEGPLLALPGGDARLAVGGGLRKLSLHLNITDFLPSGPFTFRDFTEKRDVGFAYSELSVPLVGPDMDVPLMERLTLTAALRYEHWKGIDKATTPKLGIIYQPHEDVTVRGSWGKSFKAPTLFQVNQVLQGFLLPGSIFSPQPNPPLPPGDGVLLLGGGNPNLKSERATTWSATVEYRPSFAKGLELQASYFDIDYRDRIGSPVTGTLSALANPVFRDFIILDPTVEQVNGLVASFPQGLVNQTGQPFDPSRVGAIIDSALRNTARQRIHGVDFAADYRIDLNDGDRLLVTGAASYLESDQQLIPDQPTVQMAGIIFNPPHWRGRLGATWEGGSKSLSAFLNYVGGTKDNRFPKVERISPFVTLDLSAALRTTAAAGPLRGTEVRISALNLLNEEPDIIRNSLPDAPSYDSTNQSAIGRFISLSVRKTW